MYGFLVNWVRSHVKTSLLLLVGYWATYVVIAVLTGAPVAFPMINLNMSVPPM